VFLPGDRRPSRDWLGRAALGAVALGIASFIIVLLVAGAVFAECTDGVACLAGAGRRALLAVAWAFAWGGTVAIGGVGLRARGGPRTTVALVVAGVGSALATGMFGAASLSLVETWGFCVAAAALVIAIGAYRVMARTTA
jgi:hypothetical protein